MKYSENNYCIFHQISELQSKMPGAGLLCGVTASREGDPTLV